MEIIEEFGINPILLAAQIVNFTILLVLLQKFLYKPILKVLDERKKKIAKSLKDAEEIEKRLEQSSIEQEKLLDKARIEAGTMIREAKEEAKALSEKTLTEANSQVALIMQKNSERLSLEKDQLMKDVKKDLAEIVMAASMKVSKQTIDEAANKKIVEEVIKEVRE